MHPRAPERWGDSVEAWDVTLTDEQALSAIDAAEIPLAYKAAHLWADRRGLASLVQRYRRRAVVRFGSAGQAWQRYVAFHDLLPFLASSRDVHRAAERFAETVAAHLAGPHYAKKEPPDAHVDGAPQTAEDVLDALFDGPGPEGEGLIALASIVRHRALLSDTEERYALDRVVDLVTQHLSPVPVVMTGDPGEAQLLDATERLFRDPAAATKAIGIADAIVTLWGMASERQMRRLIDVAMWLASAGSA